MELIINEKEKELLLEGLAEIGTRNKALIISVGNKYPDKKKEWQQNKNDIDDLIHKLEAINS